MRRMGEGLELVLGSKEGGEWGSFVYKRWIKLVVKENFLGGYSCRERYWV